ncbi:DUF6030 family protein [Jiella sonneratiae]|uniref:Uncharacterized protein n=1 Tax=Jiella sonneratiae TaxID=2816856 RepID=A0ABS3J6Z5_9HYPH|nr:DUF6030 family protein [Jiella sonneratiae]MBO0905451.1 hypothetical protein [Jiella sonneratiae]
MHPASVFCSMIGSRVRASHQMSHPHVPGEPPDRETRPRLRRRVLRFSQRKGRAGAAGLALWPAMRRVAGSRGTESAESEMAKTRARALEGDETYGRRSRWPAAGLSRLPGLAWRPSLRWRRTARPVGTGAVRRLEGAGAFLKNGGRFMAQGARGFRRRVGRATGGIVSRLFVAGGRAAAIMRRVVGRRSGWRAWSKRDPSQNAAAPRGRDGTRKTPVWDAGGTAVPRAERRGGILPALGLVSRLGIVALAIAGGLAIAFLNSRAGGSLGESLRRAAETGSVFGGTPSRPSAEKTDAVRPAEGDGAPIRTAELAPITTARLLMPPATPKTPEFVRLAMVSPKKLCRAIDPGRAIMTWHESAFLQGQWECYATATADGRKVDRNGDLEDGPATDDPEAVVEPALPSEPQLFVMARGVRKDALTSVRIKLIADNEAKAKAAGQRLAELAAALFAALQWNPPAGLHDKLRSLQNFQLDQAETRLIFKRELSQGWQYNLIVVFPNYLRYGDGPRFQAPPQTSGGGVRPPSAPEAAAGDLP